MKSKEWCNCKEPIKDDFHGLMCMRCKRFFEPKRRPKPKNVHVEPLNDLIHHNTNDTECECNPKLEKQINGAYVVIHNAYDGRELKEQGEVDS